MHFEYTVTYMTSMPEHGGIYYYILLKSVSGNQIPNSWSGMLLAQQIKYNNNNN